VIGEPAGSSEGRDPRKVYVVFIHPVGDYERWRSEVEGHQLNLARLGVSRHWLYRGVDDPDDIMMVLEMPSREHAERMFRSRNTDIPGWMERSGIEIYPTLFVGEPVERREYPPPPPS
jgi:hypothetical protein